MPVILTVMQKVETLRIRIRSGARGTLEPVRIRFNGHELALQVDAGDTTPGADFEGSFVVSSVAHSVELLAPSTGVWDLDEVVAVFEGLDPAERRHGPASLSDGQTLDLWNETPASFEV